MLKSFEFASFRQEFELNEEDLYAKLYLGCFLL